MRHQRWPLPLNLESCGLHRAAIGNDVRWRLRGRGLGGWIRGHSMMSSEKHEPLAQEHDSVPVGKIDLGLGDVKPQR